MILFFYDSKQGVLDIAVYKTAKSLDTEIALFCPNRCIDPDHNRVLLGNVPERIISSFFLNYGMSVVLPLLLP